MNKNSSEILEEALQRNITEFDLEAYDKNDFTQSMEKNIMRRFFDSFDIKLNGYLNEENIEKLCNYLGKPKYENLNNNKMSFDEFWNWWLEHCKNEKHIFSMISNNFSVPYHQQELMTEKIGEIYTPNYRINYYLKDCETGEKRQISPWHDIPLKVKDYIKTFENKENKYNFICEIPKWTRAKFEIATEEKYNPIKQDIKNGVPRFYKHGDMMWNYGAFPQTWESTEYDFVDGYKGDNDPVDGIEIGMTQLKSGSVSQVKVLGVLGMIDDGQMDWKVICISLSDPTASFLNDIYDVPKYLPGCLEAIREWLRVYKICQGGVENKFVFDGDYQDKEYTMHLLDESHNMWANLKKIKDVVQF